MSRQSTAKQTRHPDFEQPRGKRGPAFVALLHCTGSSLCGKVRKQSSELVCVVENSHDSVGREVVKLLDVDNAWSSDCVDAEHLANVVACPTSSTQGALTEASLNSE